jgi:hypothetical protein
VQVPLNAEHYAWVKFVPVFLVQSNVHGVVAVAAPVFVHPTLYFSHDACTPLKVEHSPVAQVVIG